MEVQVPVVAVFEVVVWVLEDAATAGIAVEDSDDQGTGPARMSAVSIALIEL